jgi:hypothetical protein
MREVREPARQKRAAEWPATHRAEYQRTACALNILAIYVPGSRPGAVPFTIQQWLNHRHRLAVFFDKRPDVVDAAERAALMRNDRPKDAWGSE